MATPNLSITHVTGSQSDKVTTINEAFDLLDRAQTDTYALDINNDNVDLTDVEGGSVQWQNRVKQVVRISVTSTTTLTADRTIFMPADEKFWLIENAVNVDEQYSVLVQVSGGTAITLPNGGSALVYCDGADCFIIARLDSDTRTAFGATTGTVDIDFDGDSIRTVTLTGSTTLALHNPRQGKSILLEVTGGGNTFAFPGSVTVIGGGTFNTGSVNYINIFCNNESSPTYLATIAQ